MKARDVLQKLSDKNISVMDGTQLVVSLGDINDAIAELELMTCENCKWFENKEGDLYNEEWQSCELFYIEAREIANVKVFSCNKWKQK